MILADRVDKKDNTPILKDTEIDDLAEDHLQTTSRNC